MRIITHCAVCEVFRRFPFCRSLSTLYHCGGLLAAAPNWMLAEWMESVSVSCEATRSGQPALTGHVTRHQCSE
ncbi:hypothetical protein QQF64_021619 [Cirrhinus molitorella]|uniref:Uncharacterized protein n=1 Tax=Cirrhinus molitorella TaxID=172907 RepID=A0ABR3L5U1_9TELE